MSVRGFSAQLSFLLIFCFGTLPSKSEPEQTVADTSDQDFVSINAKEMSELSGIWPLYQRLLQEQKKQRLRLSSDPLQELKDRQNILYLHQKISQSYQTTVAELRSALAKLDSEIVRLTDLRSVAANNRTKIQHRVTNTNLVSGGATKIGGYTAALAKAVPLPTNALEVFDGSVQMGLSALMLHQEHQEEKISSKTPESLLTFLNPKDSKTKTFPKTVGDYLNHPIPGRLDAKSRRQLVIDSWLNMRRVVQNGGRSEAPSASPDLRLLITKDNDVAVTMAMMGDIRVSLESMENSLAELSELLSNSYKQDPEF